MYNFTYFRSYFYSLKPKILKKFVLLDNDGERGAARFPLVFPRDQVGCAR